MQVDTQLATATPNDVQEKKLEKGFNYLSGRNAEYLCQWNSAEQGWYLPWQATGPGAIVVPARIHCGWVPRSSRRLDNNKSNNAQFLLAIFEGSSSIQMERYRFLKDMLACFSCTKVSTMTVEYVLYMHVWEKPCSWYPHRTLMDNQPKISPKTKNIEEKR